MRFALVVLMLAGGSLRAQQEAADPGPPYQLKVLDLVLRVQDFGERVEDLVVRESDTETRVELAADVLFDFDKADLLPKAEETLTRAAAFVKERNKGGVIRIEGHTDAKGAASYNKTLSLRRAQSVRRWLETHGLSGMRFSSDGLGADKPVAPNTRPDGSDDPEGRQKNRRVEIVIGK
jgi:outer membrane protein OmpA-like peptidoglycan-associated protein